MRWRYHEPRLRSDKQWPAVDRLIGIGTRAGLAANAAGAVLRSPVPEAGFVSSAHSRDGKAYPCKESTRGATPAWIWTGDVKP